MHTLVEPANLLAQRDRETVSPSTEPVTAESSGQAWLGLASGGSLTHASDMIIFAYCAWFLCDTGERGLYEGLEAECGVSEVNSCQRQVALGRWSTLRAAMRTLAYAPPRNSPALAFWLRKYTHRKGKQDVAFLEHGVTIQAQECGRDPRGCFLACRALYVLYSNSLAVAEGERCVSGDPGAVDVNSSTCVRAVDDKIRARQKDQWLSEIESDSHPACIQFVAELYFMCVLRSTSEDTTAALPSTLVRGQTQKVFYEIGLMNCLVLMITTKACPILSSSCAQSVW